ncbi:MAG: folylpolyglutamate synthase/dihydrofolate synthase family protein [Acidobacteriota bacterium]|nr:folylpolyglutamate synthase/dihydrofolate synthase family protein [Acidobacteriota bacterium]
MTSLERLFALEQFGIKLGLDNIRAILAALDHPERAWRSVHVAGTNGKGSVVAMVERGLRAAGLKTGRYTSPHLNVVEERVAIDGEPVDRQTFAAATAVVFDAVDRATSAGTLTVVPTFFEVSTAVAFEIFRQCRVDVAVVEVGLGGRYDATNVLSPEVTAITSIAFDHERHLGSTLSQIAFEKAGIAKPDTPLVIGRLPGEAARRIATDAAAVGAPLIDAHATTTDRTYPPLKLALPGRHQLENAAVAVAILETWSARVSFVPTEAVVTGLTDCQWPARLEWLRLPGGELLVDAAHNPAGATALAMYLKDTNLAPLPIVLAVMEDKDLTGMVQPLLAVAESFVATTVPYSRARTADGLASALRVLAPRLSVEAEPDAEAAVARALSRANRAVAAGSIYLIGPLRARLIAKGASSR